MMKAIIRLLVCGVTIFLGGTTMCWGQKIDEERMQRDIAVSANVLGTLIRQQFGNQKTFFPLEVNGSYQQGYGVTFTLPADFTTPIIFSDPGDAVIFGDPNGQFKLNINNGGNTSNVEINDNEDSRPEIAKSKTDKLKDKAKAKRGLDLDSVRDANNTKVIEAAETFLVDYGDMITQLSPQEKIIVTNQGSQPRMWVNHYFDAPNRTHLSIEVSKADLASYKQGKLNRDQAMAKIHVLNTQTVNEIEPDLELLSSIFNRLYLQDLSKTYFIEDKVYYEHLKDFGAIFYMQVISTHERGYNRYAMPTINLDDIDLETRNKKVIELYPKFEQELKENILEYGKTLKSLKDDEVLVFKVKVTRCPACGIPATLEYSVKSSTLKDFSNGKLDKKAAENKFTLKKGVNQ